MDRGLFLSFSTGRICGIASPPQCAISILLKKDKVFIIVLDTFEKSCFTLCNAFVRGRL